MYSINSGLSSPYVCSYGEKVKVTPINYIFLYVWQIRFLFLCSAKDNHPSSLSAFCLNARYKEEIKLKDGIPIENENIFIAED